MSAAIGIDLGGTNIKALAVTARGKLLTETAVPTGDSGDRRWRENVQLALERVQKGLPSPAECVGVAAPGLPSEDQRCIDFMPGRLAGLEGLVWKKYLKQARAVPVLNDAQAALLGEIWQGAARHARHAVLLTIGTGVGGAAMVDGCLLRGHIGRAGHFGHISLNPAGPLDVVNMPGSLEDAVGDCTIAKRSGGRFASTEDLVRAATHGDGGARRIWAESVKALAAGIASLINVLDPEVVVIGGGISKAGPALFKPLFRFLDQFEWRPGGHKVRIVPAQLGEKAGAYGAAFNALQQTHP
jgi:glucokinase